MADLIYLTRMGLVDRSRTIVWDTGSNYSTMKSTKTTYIEKRACAHKKENSLYRGFVEELERRLISWEEEVVRTPFNTSDRSLCLSLL